MYSGYAGCRKLFVNIGLQTGVLRMVLDPVSCRLTDTDEVPIFLDAIAIPTISIVSKIPWYTASLPHPPASGIMASNPHAVLWDMLNYIHQNLMHFTPPIFDALDYSWSFFSRRVVPRRVDWD